MKIFTGEEVRFLEKCAVDLGTGLDKLMEKAGLSVASYLNKTQEIDGSNIVVLCGSGNNGGDGFIAANRLASYGANVRVVLVKGRPKTDIAKEAFEKMENVEVLDWSDSQYKIEELIDVSDIVIDAIFGIGFKGNVDEKIARLINFTNKSKAYKLSVDIPSGCECDTGKVANCCIKADATLCFTSAKPANVLIPSSKMCGKILIAQVGISKDIVESLPASFSITKEQDVYAMFSKRDPLSHKGSFGKLLMFCGSYGMVGAGIMSARAALRSGVGLLNMVVTKECYPIMATSLPEAIFTIIDDSNEETAKKSSENLFNALNSASACVMGSGLQDLAEKYLSTIVKFAKCPLVLDADALNALAKNLDILKEKSSDIIITPHPGEMARLTKKTVEQISMDRLSVAKKFAKENNVTVVLKGSGTIIASTEGETKVNTTGNAGMAKGGSGDVLAGIIGSVLAQGMTLNNAIVSSVYIHGKAGDICAESLSQTSMLPSDVVEFLPKVFKDIESKFSKN